MDSSVKNTYQRITLAVRQKKISFNDKNATNETNNGADACVPEFISELDQIMRFETLWKSGLTSLFSLTLAQWKMNNVQHEYAISVTQKVLYFLASAFNTL